MAKHIANVVIEPGTPFKETGNRATFDVVDDAGAVVVAGMEYPAGIGGTPEEAEAFIRQVGARDLARDYPELAELEPETPPTPIEPEYETVDDILNDGIEG
jgi:hypothetical protein